MPIGSGSRRGFEPRVGSASLPTDNSLAGLGGPFRSSRRLYAWTSIAVVVLLAAGCASASTSQLPSVGPTLTPLVTASGTAPASASASIPTMAESASPVASETDTDDETSGTAGASFAANATGIVPPTSGAAAADRLPGEPDPALTPGALNPAVTQATIGSTICVSGWTATIRPSSSYTTRLKIAQIVAYGYSDTSTSAYEEDHLISLELGGAPSDPRNLWPEPYTMSLADGRPTGARTKDTFESKLKKDVCAGTISLAEAQADIGVYWVHAYYGIPIPVGTSTAGPTAAPLASAVVAAPASAGAPPAPVATLSGSITSLPASVSPGGNATLDA